MSGGSIYSVLILLLLVGVMYFLMIRPQRKREKETNAMRAGVQVGDEIITIGGICAKVVKTKEESIVIQFGPDKTKMEVMRWSVSKIVKESAKHRVAVEEDDEEETSAANAKKAKPRRMKKAAVVEDEAETPVDEAETPVEEAEEVVGEADEVPAEDVADATEAVEEAAEEAVEEKAE